DDRQRADRYADVDALQVVLARTDDLDLERLHAGGRAAEYTRAPRWEKRKEPVSVARPRPRRVGAPRSRTRSSAPTGARAPAASPITAPTPTIARRTRAPRPIRQPSRRTESSISAPLSTRTPWPRTVFRTTPPRTIAPSETSVLSAWPCRPAASAVTFAGPSGL